jgi:hypothetical protein
LGTGPVLHFNGSKIIKHADWTKFWASASLTVFYRTHNFDLNNGVKEKLKIHDTDNQKRSLLKSVPKQKLTSILTSSKKKIVSPIREGAIHLRGQLGFCQSILLLVWQPLPVAKNQGF